MSKNLFDSPNNRRSVSSKTVPVLLWVALGVALGISFMSMVWGVQNKYRDNTQVAANQQAQVEHQQALKNVSDSLTYRLDQVTADAAAREMDLRQQLAGRESQLKLITKNLASRTAEGEQLLDRSRLIEAERQELAVKVQVERTAREAAETSFHEAAAQADSLRFRNEALVVNQANNLKKLEQLSRIRPATPLKERAWQLLFVTALAVSIHQTFH